MHCCILINRVIANDFRHSKCTASPTLADQVDGRCGLYQKQTDAACYTCHIVFFSFPDRNQLKKHYHAVIQPFRLQPAVTLHKLTPQISSPVLSFERKISHGVFFKACSHLVCSARGFWYPFPDPFFLRAQKLSKVIICRGPKMHLSCCVK